MYDTPSAYWPLGLDTNAGGSLPPVIGPEFTSAGGALGHGAVVFGDAAIVGAEPPGFTYVTRDQYYRTEPIGAGHELDPGGLSEFTAELWLQIAVGLPAATESLFRGPSTAGGSTWSVELRTDGKIDVTARNSAGTLHTVTSTTALSSGGPWYYIVATITGGSLRIYIDGTNETSTAFAGAFEAVTTASVATFGNNGTDIGGSRTRSFDEVAFYRYGLPAARIAAHYEAGTARGFARAQQAGARIASVLDAADNTSPRFLHAGNHALTGAYMKGQSPLEEMRRAEAADATDAMLFISRDGTITFYEDGHRSSSPWNTVQATFDDDDTDLPYQDISLDYSESFLFNEWNVTATGGTTQTVSDATSIGLYGKRSQGLTDLAIYTDGVAASIAAAMLAKYKDPMRRVTRLEIVAHTEDVIDNIFQRDIGDRIRVLRTPPGGGARIDQTLFIQKIAVVGTPGKPRRITLGVSPL